MQSMVSFHKQLKDEGQTYEQMKRGDLGTLSSLTSIGRWLIGARIARGMTQKELAEWSDALRPFRRRLSGASCLGYLAELRHPSGSAKAT